jgi:hypothetical protein
MVSIRTCTLADGFEHGQGKAWEILRTSNPFATAWLEIFLEIGFTDFAGNNFVAHPAKHSLCWEL